MFVDTNVLVYAMVPTAPAHLMARAALGAHGERDRLCVSRQVLREFLAVVTRPQLWMRPQPLIEAASAAIALADDLEILEDSAMVWDELTSLCRRFAFGGRQVHDANIVATMLAHGERRLLTFNATDFQRFAELIEVIAP